MKMLIINGLVYPTVFPEDTIGDQEAIEVTEEDRALIYENWVSNHIARTKDGKDKKIDAATKNEVRKSLQKSPAMAALNKKVEARQAALAKRGTPEADAALSA